MARQIRWCLAVCLVLALVWIPGALAKEQVVLKWTTCCGQVDRHELFQSWARRYESRNPGIKVEWEYPSGSYGAVLLTRIVGGAGPDVMWIGGAYSELADLFASVDDMRTRTGGPLRDVMPSVFPLFSWGGKLGAAPYGANTVPFFINQRLFAEAGLQVPSPSWTWDDFLVLIKRLTADLDGDGEPDRWGFDIRSGGYQGTAVSWGGAPFTPDGRKVAFNNPITVGVTQIIVDLVTNKHGPYQLPAGRGDFAAVARSGAAAIVAGGVWGVPALRQLPEDEWEGIIFPGYEYQGERYHGTYLSGEAWAISNTTPYPAEARRFVEFLLDKEQMREFARLGGIIPTQQAVAREFFHPSTSKPQNMAAFLDCLEVGKPLWNTHPAGNEVITRSGTVWSDLWAGRLPAITAYEQMEVIGNAVLADFWAKKQ
jgi:multiple sugar transport system substrate-binding protein